MDFKFYDFPAKAFMKVYKKLSQRNREKTILFLDKTRFLTKGIKKRVGHYRGEFTVRISMFKSFRMINYGGTIEGETFTNGLFKTWEKDVGWIWKDLCKISDVIFDVGANTGIYGLTARAINSRAKIYSFEPAPHFFERLMTNNKINNYPLICEKLAISNVTGNAIFYDVPQKNETAASLSPEKLKNASWFKGEILEYDVPVMTLSDYVEQNEIPLIDLIKLDIELHEVEALEGLGKYLQIFHPIIIIEVLTSDIAEKLNKLFYLPDYLIFHLKNSSEAEKVQEFGTTKDIYETKEWNYLIFHKSLQEKIASHTRLFKRLVS